MWFNIRNMFCAGAPSAQAVFKTAMRHDRPVNISFLDQERLPGNISCKMEDLRKERVYLKLGHSLPAQMFRRDKCNLFLKIPKDILRRELGIKENLSQNGFLSKSRILDCDCDARGLSSHLCISLPSSYTRRELRHHERYRIFTGMISEAALWFLPEAGSPASPSPDFSYQQGQLCPLRLMNISAGGAKVVLDKLDFLDKFAEIEKSRLLLKLSLPVSEDQPLDTWLICRCVSSKYSINLRRFTMRLQFLTPAGLPAKGSLPVAKEDADDSLADGQPDVNVLNLAGWLSGMSREN